MAMALTSAGLAGTLCNCKCHGEPKPNLGPDQDEPRPKKAFDIVDHDSYPAEK